MHLGRKSPVRELAGAGSEPAYLDVRNEKNVVAEHKREEGGFLIKGSRGKRRDA